MVVSSDSRHGLLVCLHALIFIPLLLLQVFFVVLLQPPQTVGSSPLPGTTDPDQLITCDLMDGRDAFLTMARERHWEFSSLRRAKYSTMAMLYELHNQSGDRFVYTCDHCRMHVETRYHCRECDVSYFYTCVAIHVCHQSQIDLHILTFVPSFGREKQEVFSPNSLKYIC